MVAEARERLGGRAWTTELFRRRLDVGGTFVHWTQPHIWSELTRYGLPVSRRPAIERAVWTAGGVRRVGDLASLRSFIADAMDEYTADALGLFPRPYDGFSSSLAKGIDHLTMADGLAELSMPDDVKEAVHGFWSVNCNRPCEDGALSHALHLVALSGGDWRHFNEVCTGFKVAAGTSALIDAIRADADPEIRLRCRVRAVEEVENAVRVQLDDGGEVPAQTCIVALPLNVLSDVDFTPRLSQGKTAALEEGAPTGGFKLWVQLRGSVRSSLCMASGSHELMFARSEAETPEGTLLSCYGPDREAVDLEDSGIISDLVREWLPEVHVAKHWLHDWAADEFSRETWRVPRPGQLSKYEAVLEDAHGRVSFAGSDLARGWCGFLDGAVESGMRSAQAVRAILGPPSTQQAI